MYHSRSFAPRRTRSSRSVVLAALLLLLADLSPGVVTAQRAETEPPRATSIPEGSAPKGPVAPAFPPAIPNIDYGGRLRVGLRLQDMKKPSTLEDGERLGNFSATIDADLYFSGQIHRMLKWQIGMTLSYGGTPGAPSTVTWNLLDAIARFEPAPWLNIWAGRMIVTVDRFGQSGPWGIDEWFYPGIFSGAPLATPKTGPVGRDVGVNVWGAPFAGHLKYYLGAYQLQDPALKPLLSGRLQFSLLSPEPAFYHKNTYYGDQDLLSGGIGVQFQENGSRQPTPAGAPNNFMPLTDDHALWSADLTFEKRLGKAGSLSINGAAYLFYGDFRAWESLYLASLGYVFPRVVGIGKFRPSVRFQQAQAAADGAGPSQIVDAQLSYLVMNWYARVHLSFRHSNIDLGAGPVEGNTALLGIVLWDP
jgi:hypothetical protein